MDYPQEFLLLAGAAASEYVGSAWGMGYGTPLVLVLLLVGFDPLELVPALLASEFVTGLFAASLHHRSANVSFQRGSADRKADLVLDVCGTSQQSSWRRMSPVVLS